MGWTKNYAIFFFLLTQTHQKGSIIFDTKYQYKLHMDNSLF